MTRKGALARSSALLLFAMTGVQPEFGGAVDDRIQRLAGLGGLAGRHRQRLAQGGRRRCDLPVVRLFGLDGRLRRRQDRRQSDDQRRHAGHRRRRRQGHHDHAHRLFQRQRHRSSASPASRASRSSRARRSASRSAWSSTCCCSMASRRAGMNREGRHAGQRQDQRDAAGAGLRPGRRHRRLAADRRAGDERRCPARGRSTPRPRRPA